MRDRGDPEERANRVEVHFRREEPTRRPAKRSRWRDFRGVLRPVGAVVAGIALAQAACALIGGAVEWWTVGTWNVGHLTSLLEGAAVTAAVGVASFFYGRRFSAESLTRREASLAVVLIWLSAGLAGGVPFYFADLSGVDAFFETVSGFTTTGATVIDDIETRLSIPLLLWRSVVQWLGGMGIVVLYVAVFPSLGVGAKHMFRGEVPGTTAEGLKPRIAETSFTLWKLYAGLTLLQAVLLVACGMTPFDAVCHAMTTMSTGGFSTLDASVGGFHNPAVEYVVSVFMLLGSLNFAIYYAVLRFRSIKPILRSTELKVFVVIVALAVLATTIGILPLHQHDPERAFRMALFQVATFVSSTGYVSDDYMAYPPSILAILLLLMFMGGCSGSTAGGLKVERLVLMGKMSWAEFRMSFRPAIVQVVRMGRAAVPQEILSDVAVFLGVYVAVIAGGVLFVSAVDGVSLPTAFGATLTSLANSGPAAFWNGADNFKAYSDVSKVFFAIVMLLGRLELFTMFALLVPDFWRR